ncbi:MAG: caspase family protein [Desulfobacterales bacterium]|nr:caspase family protein [Desulfobacterales bacterium]
MAAYSLLTGLKSVNPIAYNGWNGTTGCWGCELDVDNMARILKSQGFQVKSLKTQDATHDNILSSLYRAAENTKTGDIFVFYYSGHGGQQPDIDKDELDGKDETLVAYDREIVDDKIHNALKKFKSGVSIVMVSDSCNSGSNYRGWKNVTVKEDKIFRPIASKVKNEINAQLIHLGGCRDGYTSSGYYGGGAFTVALCEAWNNGNFRGSYKELHNKICELITSSQKPQYSEYGPVSDAFRNQRAFCTVISPSLIGPGLSVYYHSWTDTIIFENKHVKHTQTEYEYNNPISAVPSGMSQLLMTDADLNDQQWEALKDFVENSGFEKLENAYGAPEDHRHYPYVITINWDTKRKEVKYRSNPNFGEPPEAFKNTENYLFNLSQNSKR